MAITKLSKLFSKEAPMTENPHVKKVIADIESFASFGKVTNLSQLIALILEVVTKVQTLTADVGGLSGEQKKQVATDVINHYINIPTLPEAAEGVLISFGIDLAVEQLKKIAAKKGLTPDKWILLFQ